MSQVGSLLGWGTGDLPSRGEKLRVPNPTRRMWRRRLSAPCTHPQGDTLLKQDLQNSCWSLSLEPSDE